MGAHPRHRHVDARVDGEAKVAELDRAVLHDEHVLRLDVSVDDAPRVQVGQALQHRGSNLRWGRRWRALASYEGSSRRLELRGPQKEMQRRRLARLPPRFHRGLRWEQLGALLVPDGRGRAFLITWCSGIHRRENAEAMSHKSEVGKEAVFSSADGCETRGRMLGSTYRCRRDARQALVPRGSWGKGVAPPLLANSWMR